jgi:hypothetical protein
MPTLQPSHTRVRARACRADKTGTPQPQNSLSTECLADLRAREQDLRCAPTHGGHEHPTREQDESQDPLSVIGVRLPAHLLPPLSSDRTCRGQRFPKIAQADAAQLARLPGFGLKKVAMLKIASL